MSRAAFQAAFYTTDQSWPQLEPTCPSAHCTWPLFNTLAICTSLGNVTGHLKIEEIDAKSSMEDRRYNVSLPLNLGNLNEEWMGGVPRRHVNMTSPAIPPAQYTETPVSSSEDSLEEFPLTRAPFPDKRNTLHDWGNDDILLSTFSQYTFIYNVDNTDPDDKDHRFRAVEVLWHFCVDTYNVTVTDGITSTEKVGNSVKIDEISVNSDGLNSFTLAARVDDGSKETFNISASWAYSRLDWDFRDVLGGAWSDMYGIGQYTEFNYQLGRNLYRGVNDNMTVVEADERMWNNLQNLTGTIANGMTT